MNCHIWASGKVEKPRYTFPYKARSVVESVHREFETIDDVYDELMKSYNQLTQQGYSNIGEGIYLEHFYYANTKDLVDPKCQSMIKAYIYCMESNTPPYRSLQETPANFIDDFLIINEEINNIKKRNAEIRANEVKNGRT